jgi:uncharacterized protein with gpF-like domain
VPRVATLTPTEIEDILSHAFGHYAEQEMLRTYHQLLLEAGDAGAQWVAQFIDKPQTVTTSHRRLRQVAEERAPKIRGINKTTQEKLRKSLGLAAKETDEAALKKAARLAVTDVFEDALERRAPEIAINETALGWGTGEYEQELEFGIPAHVWQTRGDEQVRESHAAMDGQCVSIDEPFISGDGNELQYPGDPSAPPSDTYNCRCEVIPLTGDCDSRSARHWTPARRRRYEKAAGSSRRREERKALAAARRIFRGQQSKVREALERALRD